MEPAGWYVPGMLTRPQPHEAEATTHEAKAEATTHEAEATTHEAEAEVTPHDNAKKLIMLGWVTHSSIDAIFKK